MEYFGASPSGKASDSDSDISGVRIPVPQPKNDNLRQKVVVFTFSLFTLHFSLKPLVVFWQVISNSE